jgi:hypothetical protein
MTDPVVVDLDPKGVTPTISGVPSWISAVNSSAVVSPIMARSPAIPAYTSGHPHEYSSSRLGPMLSRLHTWWNFRQALRKRTPLQAASAANKDIVVLPCWRRPEFLWHCLDNLAQAQGVEEVSIMVRPDTGFAGENIDVVRSFAARLPNIDIQYPVPAPYRRTKQSANVLLGYLDAASAARQFVYLVEEDIMVARDFFRWHREVHAAASRPLFCSIAVANPNRKLSLPQELGGYYLSSADYCSTGVCFDRTVLRSLLAPHVNMRYMGQPKSYIRRHFPHSRIGLGFVEQDGLIRRIQESGTLPIAWPCIPRAFHAGFYGYNRSGGIEGTLQQRIQQLSQTIYDAQAMRQAATGSEAFPDHCMPCELQLPPWQTLHQLQVPLAAQVSG